MRRPRRRQRPAAGPTNLWLEPGDRRAWTTSWPTPSEGLLVTWLFGQGFNPVTGDFSRGAAGHVDRRRASLSHPVEEITIAGNLLRHARGNVDAVGGDLLWQGTRGAPQPAHFPHDVAGE